MPNSSNDLPLSETAEVEDIFSETVSNTATIEPTPDPEIIEDAGWSEVRPSGQRWLLIAIIGGGLLVLLGIGLVMWFWFSDRSTSVSNNSNTTINDTSIHPTVDTNTTPTNIEVNTNQPNTNTTSTNDVPFTDIDHDGLSDQEELVANTNPKKRDTDEDGLSDREEVRVYLTDPRNPDTDGDGYADGKEVENFYHPNDPDPKKRLFDLPN